MMYLLSDAQPLPDASTADDNGIVALGGTIHPTRVLQAYASGIFPWPHPFIDEGGREQLHTLWFSPNPRYVLRLLPSRIHIGRSLRKCIRQADPSSYRFVVNNDFARVVHRCATTQRPDQDGTWISSEIQKSYHVLHDIGHAHCAELYLGDKLIGGLYGMQVGDVFCGESMFSLQSNASKMTFVAWMAHLHMWGFSMIDCQVHTAHLEQFGAEFISRQSYLQAIDTPTSNAIRIQEASLSLKDSLDYLLELE